MTEKYLHQLFEIYNIRREWFAPSENLIDYINQNSLELPKNNNETKKKKKPRIKLSNLTKFSFLERLEIAQSKHALKLFELEQVQKELKILSDDIDRLKFEIDENEQKRQVKAKEKQVREAEIKRAKQFPSVMRQKIIERTRKEKVQKELEPLIGQEIKREEARKIESERVRQFVEKRKQAKKLSLL